MGWISVILVKNHLFILLNKFNLHTIIYDSVKFQTSITDLQSFIRPYVNFYAIWIPYKGFFHSIFLNFHFSSIFTNSKCKGFYNFEAIKLKFFLYVPQSMFNKTVNSIFFYISPTFQIKNQVHKVETKKFRKLSFDKKYFFLSFQDIFLKYGI